MPRVAKTHADAFSGASGNGGNRKKKGGSICELSDYEKLNGGDGKSSDGDGTSGTDSSFSSSDGSTDSGKKKTQGVAVGGKGRHTKRLADMKIAAAVAAATGISSAGAKHSGAGTKVRKTTTKGVGSSSKKKVEANKKQPAAAAAKTRKQKVAAAKPKASSKAKATPGRLVRYAEHYRQLTSPWSPIHSQQFSFTPEAAAVEGGGGKKGRGGRKAKAKSKTKRAALVSGGTGRFNIKQKD